MSPLTIVAIIAGVGYLLVRRMAGQQVELKSLLVLPAVLTVIGLTDVEHLHLDATTVGFAVVGILASVGIGVIRGCTVHLGERSGQLWMRYRTSTVLLWVLNFGIKALAVPVERAMSPASASAADHTLLLSIGLGVLAESVVVVLRAMGTDASVVWEKGEDGASHTRSAAFDQAQQRMSSGAGFRTRDW